MTAQIRTVTLVDANVPPTPAKTVPTPALRPDAVKTPFDGSSVPRSPRSSAQDADTAWEPLSAVKVRGLE
jgi:hypothetical protein